ncbi:MAG TPA: HEAT repeat domain-containing protein [Polyangiaceae bacterium]
MYRFVGLVLATAFVLFAAGARADDRTTFLARNLKSDDFRVRANAAVALGATNDEAAVQPLCGALSDSNDLVRSTAAAAIKHLAKPASVGCLKARLAVEPVDSVKLQLTRAIESFEGAGGGGGGGTDDGPPKQVANAKYYVSISSIMNNTGRPQAEIDRVVLGAMKAKFESLGNVQLAPKVETPDAARAVMQRRNLKGYYLSVAVSAFENTAQGLKVTIQLSVASYPGKNILGAMGPNATMPGTRSGDHGAEDTLLQATATQAVQAFAQNFQ